jgi:hypothetical protein
MSVDSQSNFEMLKWMWPSLFVPVFGWAFWRFCAWRAEKRRRDAMLAAIKGLPAEAKDILIGFYKEGTHTMSGNLDHHGMMVLLSRGLVSNDPRGMTNYTTHDDFTIRPDVWDVINDMRGRI